MSKLALFLLFFVLVSNATFVRPWENASWVASNPNIVSVGMEVWWNLPELQKTLDSVQLPEETQDAPIDENVLKAHNAKNAALKNYYECMALPELVKLWGNQGTSPVALFQSFNAAISCMEYGNNWKLTIDHSLNALELSEKHAANSISESRFSFDQVESMGLCNLSFSARPDGLCNSGKTAFLSYDSSLNEGNFGTMSIFQNHSEELSKQLRSHGPDLSSFNPAFGLLWGPGGTIPVHEEMSKESLEAMKTAELQYGVLLSAAQKRKRLTETKFSELKKQKIHLIRRAPSSNEIDFTGTVSDYFVQLQIQKDLADQDLQEVLIVHSSVFQSGYMATAISQANRTAIRYSYLISETDSLYNAAQLTVNQQMADAISELAKTNREKKLTPESIDLIEKANTSFASAQKSTLLGVQYEKYSESEQFARMARSQRSSESEILVKSSISKLQTLIANAKKDDIDVTTEEETLSLLNGLRDYEIDSYVQSAISNIISKANLKYGNDLMQKRSELIKKIRLGESTTQDLYLELQNLEFGIVVDGNLVFPEAIGHLKDLKLNYEYVEEELSLHLGDVLGNSMAGSATPIFSQVYLDVPAEVLLDFVVTNPLQYGARNVQVPILVSPPFPFLHSDVTSGKESLSSLYVDGNYLLLTFSNVSPFEKKRISMSKSLTLAHTNSKSIHAAAIGNGVALVNEVLEFQLDSQVPHLELLQDNAKATIDGANPNRPLDSGKHILNLEYYVSDAYVETVSNLNTYPVGPKSQVEYVITITPKISLDTIPILVESANNSGVSSMSIYAITGEKMSKPKKLSEKAYSAEISGLVANVPSKVHVSYLIEDSKSFFESEAQIYQNIELGPTAKMLFDQAQNQATSGNYSKAIEIIKQLQTAHKSEQTSLNSLRKKAAELSNKLSGEISELDGLPSDVSKSPFLSKLEARKSELTKLSNNLPALNLSQRVSALGAVDFKWLGKELNAYTKSAYKDYNDLKERFYLAGNSTTATEFLSFESSLNRLQASPQVEYAVAAVASLEKVRSVVENQEKLLSDEKSGRKLLTESLQKHADSILGTYSKQLSAAKGTDYSGRFVVSASNVEKQINDIDKFISSDPRIFNEKLSSLNTAVRKMGAIISSLENESSSSATFIEHLISQLPDSDSKSDLRNKLLTMRKLHESGEYVNSLRAGAAISDKLKQTQTNDEGGLLILGISAIAILAALAFYLFKPKPKPKLKKVPKLNDF